MGTKAPTHTINNTFNIFSLFITNVIIILCAGEGWRDGSCMWSTKIPIFASEAHGLLKVGNHGDKLSWVPYSEIFKNAYKNFQSYDQLSSWVGFIA